jgi:uncharacterized membrane protein YhhN
MTLTKSEKLFSLFYLVFMIFEQLTANYQEFASMHYLAKPLLVFSLILFFWIKSKLLNNSLRVLVLMALIFSLLGDGFLMSTNYKEPFFISGLFSFLMAHILYIFAFRKQKGNLKIFSLFSLVIFLFAIGLFILINAQLKSLFIPVVIYMIAIITMVISAYLRKGAVSYFSFTIVLLGALFFLVSDSLIALNKFYKPITYPTVSIMISYAIAQYCIIIGLLKNQKKNKNSLNCN